MLFGKQEEKERVLLLASLSSVESCIIATKSSTLDLSIARSSAVKTSCLLAMPGRWMSHASAVAAMMIFVCPSGNLWQE